MSDLYIIAPYHDMEAIPRGSRVLLLLISLLSFLSFLYNLLRMLLCFCLLEIIVRVVFVSIFVFDDDIGFVILLMFVFALH